LDLIYGTGNPSKLKSMKKMLKGMNLTIRGLRDLPVLLEEPEETGNDPLSNAVIKAEFYYQQLKKPLFSCDSGLYFENVEEHDQPGVHIKRIHGQNLKEKEFIDYYSRLAAKYNGRLTAYYKNSICLVLDENNIFKFDGASIQSERFYIVDKPHRIYREGFPLDSLSVHIESDRYYFDLGKTKNDSPGIIEGFRGFFQEHIIF
jgi:inosine/xanthosine triphosphate pyrophosphatase family protein